MNGADREKYIHNDSDFRGYVIAKLEEIHNTSKSHKQEFEKHKTDDEVNFRDLKQGQQKNTDNIKYFKAWLAGAVFVVGAITWFINSFM